MDFAITRAQDPRGFVRSRPEGRGWYNRRPLQPGRVDNELVFCANQENIEESDGTVIYRLRRLFSGGTKLTRDYANNRKAAAAHLWYPNTRVARGMRTKMVNKCWHVAHRSTHRHPRLFSRFRCCLSSAILQNSSQLPRPWRAIMQCPYEQNTKAPRLSHPLRSAQFARLLLSACD